MWPWGHAAVGYVAYVIVGRARGRTLPGLAETVVLLFGTQFPDLVDKPLAWSLHVLPTGRSLAHSFLVVVPVSLAVYWMAARYQRRPLGLAFGVGYVIGVLTDVPASVLVGDFSKATFVLWPLLELPAYETEPSWGAHLTTVDVTPSFVVQLALAVVVGIVALVTVVRIERGS